MFDLALTMEKQQTEKHLSSQGLHSENFNQYIDTMNAVRLFPLLIFKRMCEYGKLNMQHVPLEGSGEKNIKNQLASASKYYMHTHQQTPIPPTSTA
jgi:hypothetical protein